NIRVRLRWTSPILIQRNQRKSWRPEKVNLICQKPSNLCCHRYHRRENSHLLQWIELPVVLQHRLRVSKEDVRERRKVWPISRRRESVSTHLIRRTHYSIGSLSIPGDPIDVLTSPGIPPSIPRHPLQARERVNIGIRKRRRHCSPAGSCDRNSTQAGRQSILL